MKVLPGMTDEIGHPLNDVADFLGLYGTGVKIERDGDVGVIIMDSTSLGNAKGRFSARDLTGIAGRIMAVAAAITADYGDHDPYSEEIRKEFTRNG